MAVSIKKKTTKAKKVGFKPAKPVVNKSMTDYSQDLFFLKKAEAAKKFIDQNGLPK
jgi:hypothetical protein